MPGCLAAEAWNGLKRSAFICNSRCKSHADSHDRSCTLDIGILCVAHDDIRNKRFIKIWLSLLYSFRRCVTFNKVKGVVEMENIKMINFIISMAFAVCYAYQYFYIIVPFIKKDKPHKTIIPHRYAVLIAARNEETVIAQLIQSIEAQDYPSELITVFVVADNCTDSTADVARQAGATVWERFDNRKIGKGHGLDFLLSRIGESHPKDYFDGYFVFDADNLLSEDYISEMNKTFSDGHRIVTSYRNSKNYGDNWITAGYALWFLREARQLNHARMLLGTSCAVSGTGFLVHREILEGVGGWKFFLLTEDIEFTVYNVLKGEKIAYCKTAVFYDEQPVTFRQSWRQRMRWAKGYFQVFAKYGKDLLRGIFTKGSFSCFDMTMTIMPAMILTIFSVLMNLTAALYGFLFIGGGVKIVFSSLFEMLINMYLMLLILGGIATVTEWKQIHCSTAKKIAYIFTFPIFMSSYIPISITAMFRRVEWSPIHHHDAKTLSEVRSGVKKSSSLKEDRLQ